MRNEPGAHYAVSRRPAKQFPRAKHPRKDATELPLEQPASAVAAAPGTVFAPGSQLQTLTLTPGLPQSPVRNSTSRNLTPLVPLLDRWNTDRSPKPEDRIALIGDAKRCLARACRQLAFPKFSHHDFRHFFATTCIESGVDIPTISRWLGHKDGGALAMRVYGHLRADHSRAVMTLVSF